MGDRVVINASPLIFLARGGHLGLLRAFAREVWVPDVVVGDLVLILQAPGVNP